MNRAFSRAGDSWLVRTPIAHRGSFDNRGFPENSLAAFRASIDRDLAIEIDVHLRADGVPVVIHDSQMNRLTGRSGRISDLTSSEARKLRLFGTDETVPLLEEVLELVGGRVPLLIELKTTAPVPGRLERAVVRTLSGYSGELALQSFSPMSVAWLRFRAPGILRGQLSGSKAGVPIYSVTMPDFIAYRVEDLPHRRVTELRERGVPVIAWTVRSAEQRELAAQYADNIIIEDWSGGPL
jgi:glycerophosphoryl diester phosphodiesterase